MYFILRKIFKINFFSHTKQKIRDSQNNDLYIYIFFFSIIKNISEFSFIYYFNNKLKILFYLQNESSRSLICIVLFYGKFAFRWNFP